MLQECLFRICILQFYYQPPYKKKRDYVREIKTFSNDKVDEYWYYYFSLNRRIETLYRKEKVVTEYPSDLEKAHEKLLHWQVHLPTLKDTHFTTSEFIMIYLLLKQIFLLISLIRP